MSRAERDVIIIGAGHNGLVCAAYLAAAGKSVTVLEQREVVGGAAVTEEFAPGFKNSVAAYTVSLLHPKIITDLELARHSLRIVNRPLANFFPFPDGRYLKVGADRTADEVRKFSARDALRLPQFTARLDALADALRNLMLETPPNVTQGSWLAALANLMSAGRLGKRLGTLGLPLQRELLDVFTKSAGEYLEGWFESDAVQAAFGFDSIVGHFASPYASGCAYVLLHHALGEVNGRKGAWGHAIGGMGAISEAIAAAARERGVEIRVGCGVGEVLVERGSAVGVITAQGETLTARCVVSNVHPKILFERLVRPDALDDSFKEHIATYKSGSGTFRMNVALSELPNFTALPGTAPAEHHGAGIVIAPSLAYMEEAYLDARAAGWSKKPIVEIVIPSTLDDSLAPEGAHVASLFCQHVAPILPDGESWDRRREQVADLMIDRVNDFAPNFKASVLARQIKTPADLEREFGLIGGDIFHGQLTLDQLFFARPVLGNADYRAPIAGLYMCGASTHPGGGVSGAPGHNAAREILADFRKGRMRKTLRAIGALLIAAMIATPLRLSASEAEPTLETIMADPDWIGPPVEDPYWSADGKAVYYSLKRVGVPIADLHRIALAGGEDSVVDGHALAQSDGPCVFDRAHARAAFIRNGDVFVRDLRSQALRQITRTERDESSPQFSVDGKLLSFRAGNDWFVHDFAADVTAPAARVELADDPDAPPKPDDLREAQLRLFSTLRKDAEQKKALRRHADELRKTNPAQLAAPFYLGTEVSVVDTELSPDARWLAIITQPKNAEKGHEGKLARYVTESGFEEFESVRTRVGRNAPAPQSLLLLDLSTHAAHAVSFDSLPGIQDDPLRAIRAENGVSPPEKPKGAKQLLRGAIVASEEANGKGGIAWSRSGASLAISVRAIDNKDRWLASMDLRTFSLTPEYRLTDSAWVNWEHAEFGWLHDERTLWFLSEESGFAHLYTKGPRSKPRALTRGNFEVSQPRLSNDGAWLYFIANAQDPVDYDVYRLPSAGGALEQVSQAQGAESFALSPDDAALLLTHSQAYVPPQLALLELPRNGARAAPARELTDTRSAKYKAISWLEPRFVQVPSTHFNGSLHAKLYEPPSVGPGSLRPAVLFVHGAGYLQNVYRRFPAYFREQMFHNLLVRRGFTVLDIDYRASEGYGRDWRTAIYRQMGHPELDDLLDGKRWLVQMRQVDAHRVGIYGGSYGGFLALMALFRAPGEFAAGAALRPVTDWLQYNHEYTADILNSPKDDPLAYRRSSPIEFAAGLQDPLLICHGVMDDNVLFEDSMRLYQRLIELHKNNFTLSPYPLDRHLFMNADSWLDEYKRIDQLFERYLNAPRR